MPSTLTYPGVYIEELPSGVHTIVGGMSVSARMGTTFSGQWGPTHRLRCESFLKAGDAYPPGSPFTGW
jgi:hypothetical protein